MGNIGQEIKILVDDAREITAEQATGYQLTGKTVKVPTSRGKKPKVLHTGPGAVVSGEAKPRLYLRLADSGNPQLLMQIKSQLDGNPGETDVVFVMGPPETKQIIKLPAGVTIGSDLTEALENLIGRENVRIQ